MVSKNRIIRNSTLGVITIRDMISMGMFCKHQYGKKTVGKSPVIETTLFGEFYYIRIRGFKRCQKCGKEIVFSDERSMVPERMLREFIEENYIEGTSMVMEDSSTP